MRRIENVVGSIDSPEIGGQLHRLAHAGLVEYIVLSRPDLARHRLRVKSTAGNEYGIALPRSQHLSNGAVLLLEDDRAVVGHFVEIIDEDRAEVTKSVYDEAIVDDFVAHVDRRAEPFERQLDDLDRAIDAGAEAPRGGDEDSERWLIQHWESHVSLRLQA